MPLSRIASHVARVFRDLCTTLSLWRTCFRRSYHALGTIAFRLMPSELRELFMEMNGASVHPAFFNEIGEEDDTMQIIWTLDDIRQENQELRARDDGSEPAFARLSQFLFFAREPNGDPIGYAVAEGRIADPQLIVMSHEDYEDRHIQCGSLNGYLTVLMEASQ